TSLSGGKRIPKHHVRVEAYGSVDELTAWIGLLRDHSENEPRKEILVYIQDQLMRCAAILASEHNSPSRQRYLPDEGSVEILEKEIDKMELMLPPLKNFLIPGGHKLVSYCHLARCVCRRAERAVLRLNLSEETPLIIHKFLNRLSDYLFVLARLLSLELGIEEVIWTI
ncbi:MAG TPA: cob(I)yrinic acid a,c-diamide adenosyltransferase, partial [Bacteroidales bacterium]|nr:cob(I)yrinic acid a,c-diamide adenosyltransferase [Bacteroidales bacterium]